MALTCQGPQYRAAASSCARATSAERCRTPGAAARLASPAACRICAAGAACAAKGPPAGAGAGEEQEREQERRAPERRIAARRFFEGLERAAYTAADGKLLLREAHLRRAAETNRHARNEQFGEALRARLERHGIVGRASHPGWYTEDGWAERRAMLLRMHDDDYRDLVATEKRARDKLAQPLSPASEWVDAMQRRRRQCWSAAAASSGASTIARL